MSQKKPAQRRIGLIALVLIIIMAIVPAFLQVGLDLNVLSTVNQMFIVGLIMTIVYSSWKVDKNRVVTADAIIKESQVLVFGVAFGLMIVISNAVTSSGGNLLLGSMDPNNLYLVLLAGVSEELFFRGFLQNAFKMWIRSVFVVIPSALVFMLFHYFRYGMEPVAMLVMFVIGIGFGLAYEFTNDIGTPMLAHIINNGIGSFGLVASLLQGSVFIIGILIVVLIAAMIIGRASRGRR